MRVQVYRRIRITVGALVILFCTLAFANVGGWFSAQVLRVGIWLQFTPSLLAALQGVAWISLGFIVILGLTLLFGRIYCAMLCPLGVLMDFSAWVARRSGKKRRLGYRRGRSGLRTIMVAVCVVGLLAGSAVPLALLDPYSIFGRMASALLRPLVGIGNHQLSATGWFLPSRWSPVAPLSLAIALTMLLVVVLLAVFRGRLWCNTLCPVGSILGFLSRFSLFRLQMSADACVACSMCERVCPSQCIDFKNLRIDHSRCVMCFNCVTSCRRNGIHFRRARYSGDELFGEALTEPVFPRGLPAIRRRAFLAGAAALPGMALAEGRGKTADGASFNARAVLPPGARSLARFQSRCTACHLCVTNCPEQVLRPSITAHGLAGFLQPWQDFSVSFCSYNCSNCSEVCPTGAIETISVEERRTVRTGKVHFFEDLCVVKTAGTPCGACNEHCPTQAVHMVPYKGNLTIPEIDPELCIGCGGCEFICPVRPHKAIVVDGLDVHELAKPVDRGVKNSVREIEEEFPF